MKKIIFLIFMSLIFYTIVFAETQRELFDKGVLLFKQGQHQQAIDTFSKLIEIAPDNADAYKNRGVSYMKQEKFDLAIQDFEKAKKLFPELKGLYSNLGVAWYYKKEYEKAIESYEIEIEMAPENHVAYFNRALCLAELDQNKQALDDLSKTLSLKPDFYWAICYKADLLVLEGENIRAIETYEEAIKQDPNSSYATEKLVQLKQKIKKKDKPESTKEPSNSYALQAGAFLNQANAHKMNTQLINKGFDSRILILKDSRDRTWYLVRSGNYTNRDGAQKACLSLKNKLGINPLIRPVSAW
ncbi:MAG: tetratricopeptide repeat protein [Desulfobacula sp.]|uniref:SPOR domain-containing protein n=1 Tax=Desulfobacula sp. TaxID=2593537 RepID=UPI0025BDD2B0|nr:SPOR domain-containing protein [Desulfobacula sp.]MCD4718867.1 tetratricopeptide repeat protein [Desulfobacula sp.]